tara:strand:- start:110 stop:1909 length:1800 start_codon:yes stop_codon:yes gene_type:complete
MNKAVMIALLFCLTSFTGCLGGDDLEQIEEIQEEETIEPVGENDLSNLSKELEALKVEVDQFLADYEALQGKVNDNQKSIDLNASEVQQLNNQFNQLNSRLELLENDHVSYEQTVTGEIEIIESRLDEINQVLYQAASMREHMKSTLDNLTIMSLMDDEQRHVFGKMMLVQHIKDNGAVNMNLTGADLSGVDFTGVSFAGADLSYANLDGARFVGNNFTEANMDNSHANGAYFRLVNFDSASIFNSHWNAVEIVDSDAENAKFHFTEMHNCIIHHTSLVESNFDRVKANDCYFYFVEGDHSSWKGASLDHSTFEVSSFNKADFSQVSNAHTTNMVGVTYASVSFIEATFAYADMSHSTMEVSPNLPSGFLHTMNAGGMYWRNCIDANGDGDNNDCGYYGDYEDYYDYSRDQEYENNYMWFELQHRYINCVDFAGADLNNTKLDHSEICVTQLPEGFWQCYGCADSQHTRLSSSELQPINARFEDTQFRRADMTNVHFGGSMITFLDDGTPSTTGSSEWNGTAGCYSMEISCMNLRGAALTLADLSDSHFDYADLSGADFSGSSAAGVYWGHAMWNKTNWTDSSEIKGRGDPNEWDSDDD